MTDDEAWEIVTQMAGGANVGPRFLSLARLVVSLDRRLGEVEAWDAQAALGAVVARLEEVEGRAEHHTERISTISEIVSSITQGMEDADDIGVAFGMGCTPVSQSSTRTPGIGADMEQADGEREAFTLDFLLDDVVRPGQRADHLPDGSMRCPHCWRVPCRCGVPALFAQDYERLARLAAAALRSSAQKDGEQGRAHWLGRIAAYVREEISTGKLAEELGVVHRDELDELRDAVQGPAPSQTERTRTLSVLRSLAFAARTSGGTPGPDRELMDACSAAEDVLVSAGYGYGDAAPEHGGDFYVQPSSAPVTPEERVRRRRHVRGKS